MVWGCFRGPGDEDLCVVTDGQAVLAAGCLISLFRSLYAALTSVCSSDLMEDWCAGGTSTSPADMSRCGEVRCYVDLRERLPTGHHRLWSRSRGLGASC